MKRIGHGMALARVVWIVASMPLALLSAYVILATFPGVLTNSTVRLAIIGYVVVCPIIIASFRPRNTLAFNAGAATLIAAQIVSFFAFNNFWF
jgi:hypothetical protein